MEIFGMVVFVAVLLLGIISPFFGLPGTFIIFADALIYGLVTRFQKVTFWFLILLLGLAVAGEIFEFFANILGAKHYGASRLGLAGGFLGAFLFELFRKEGTKRAITAGLGAFLGRVAAIAVKVLITIIMAILILTKIL